MTHPPNALRWSKEEQQRLAQGQQELRHNRAAPGPDSKHRTTSRRPTALPISHFSLPSTLTGEPLLPSARTSQSQDPIRHRTRRRELDTLCDDEQRHSLPDTPADRDARRAHSFIETLCHIPRSH